MRLLMITQKLEPQDDIFGFAHGWVEKLSRHLDHLYVLAMYRGAVQLPLNVTALSGGKERGYGRLRRVFQAAGHVARLTGRKEVDGILVHMCPEFAILAAPFAKPRGLPMVMWFVHRQSHYRLRVAHWLVDSVATASNESFPLGSDKVVVLGHGIDMDRFVPGKAVPLDLKRIILSVGRISPVKDYESLIRAASILVHQRQITDVKFVIIGDVDPPRERYMPYFRRLQDLVESEGLGEWVHFMGPVPYQQMVSYYQACSIFLNLTQSGSMDKAALEAMACGCVPLVCSQTFRDLLEEEADRLVFSEGNPFDLSDKLAVLLNVEMRELSDLGRKLREKVVQEHNLDRLSGRLVEVFSHHIRRDQVGWGEQLGPIGRGKT